MASLMPQGKQQYFDSNGNPLAGGRVYTYEAGTSTPLATYSDQAGAVPNANPVVLNARGEATIFWGSAPYKVALKDASDVEIWTQDNLQSLVGVADLASTSATKGAALVGFDGGTLAAYIKNKSAQVVDSITALRAIDKTKFTRAFATGYYAAGDGGGGGYWYDSSDTTTADDGGTVIVASDGGRWKLLHAGEVSVRQFGAKLDGVTDDSAATNGALAASASIRLVIPAGTLVATGLSAPAGADIIGKAGATIKHKTNAGSVLLTAAGGIKVRGVKFDGNISNQSVYQDVLVVSTGDVEIDDCTFLNASGRAIGGGATNIRVRYSKFSGCDNYPVQISGATDFLVHGCEITFSSGAAISTPDIRAIQPTSCANVVVSDNFINTGRKYRDGVWASNCTRVTVTGNSILETQDDQVTILGTTGKVSVVGNTLSGSNTTGGVLILANSPDHEDITISGNVIHDCGGAGVEIRNVTRCVVSGNSIKSAVDGVRLPLASPSTNVIIDGNAIAFITDYGVDCGAGNRVTVSNNHIEGTTGADIGVHGRSASDITVSGNEISGFPIGVQTSQGKNIVCENLINGATSRGISLQAGDAFTIAGNALKECENPIVVVSGQGIAKLSISGNVITKTVVSVNHAIQGGDAVDITMTGNTISGYGRPFSSAAGSNYGVYVGNNARNCTNPVDLSSMATSASAGNL